MPDRTTLASNQGTSLADLLDRVVDRGAFVSGDVIIQLAGIDLIRLDLRLLLIGIETAHELDDGMGGRRDEA